MPDNGKLLAAAIQEASGKKPVRVSSKKNIGISPSVGSQGVNNCERIGAMFGGMGDSRVIDNIT